MKKTVSFLAVFALAAAVVVLLHAQDIATTSTAPDSIVQLTAESNGLPVITLGEMPAEGTFWIVTPNGVLAPFPFLPLGDQGAPIYAITDGSFLVDATSGQVNPQALSATTTADALEILASEVENIVIETQTAASKQQAQTMTSGALVMDAGGGGFAPAFDFPADSLWLEMTKIGLDGAISFNLHNATDQVYAVWSTTNLSTPFAGWQVEAEVWPTNGTVMPWSVAMSSRDTLFLRAEDWTGVTQNGNQIPCWWFWKYFGTLGLSDTNLDSQGNTLLYDYQNGLDPNVISFTLSFTNQYANAFGASVQFIGPTNVSFYRVNVMEIGEVATNATGYFADTNTWPASNLDHSQHGANVWSPLNQANIVQDRAFSGTCISPWSPGDFTWPIPAAWQVVGGGVTNSMAGWSQNFLIDSSGTVNIQKFQRSVTRTTSDTITTQ